MPHLAVVLPSILPHVGWALGFSVTYRAWHPRHVTRDVRHNAGACSLIDVVLENAQDMGIKLGEGCTGFGGGDLDCVDVGNLVFDNRQLCKHFHARVPDGIKLFCDSHCHSFGFGCWAFWKCELARWCLDRMCAWIFPEPEELSILSAGVLKSGSGWQILPDTVYRISQRMK